MELLDKPTFICRKARENAESPAGSQVYWSRHAITEMVQDPLSRFEVETALQDWDVIEDYPATQPRVHSR